MTCLLWLAINTIEAIGPDVGNLSIGRQTRIQKQCQNDALMKRVLEICDPNTYVDD